VLILATGGFVDDSYNLLIGLKISELQTKRANCVFYSEQLAVEMFIW